MTVNAYIFAWDMHGIENIIPITEYEGWDKMNTMRALKGEALQRNPVNDIVRNLVMRARYNTHRNYEIYAVDCSEEMNENYWRDLWSENPQVCADTIRQKGIELFTHGST